VWRRFEVAAWATSLAVIVVVVASVATSVAPRERGQSETRVTTETKVTTQLPNCAFFPCEHPVLSGKPTRVRIPSIHIESPLEALARDRTGVLQPPTSNTRAGWFAEGVVPGNVGPAVIAGHVDSKDGKAVFYDLNQLRTGDEIQVLRGGQWVTFQVTGTEQYAKSSFPTKRVYGNTPDAELRLITCGGEFDRTLQSYRDNIVVFAMVDWSRTPASALS
jgi:LPXTG-site transpeptidase (sortase) family protein